MDLRGIVKEWRVFGPDEQHREITSYLVGKQAELHTVYHINEKNTVFIPT